MKTYMRIVSTMFLSFSGLINVAAHVAVAQTTAQQQAAAEARERQQAQQQAAAEARERQQAQQQAAAEARERQQAQQQAAADARERQQAQQQEAAEARERQQAQQQAAAEARERQQAQQQAAAEARERQQAQQQAAAEARERQQAQQQAAAEARERQQAQQEEAAEARARQQAQQQAAEARQRLTVEQQAAQSAVRTQTTTKVTASSRPAKQTLASRTSTATVARNSDLIVNTLCPATGFVPGIMIQVEDTAQGVPCRPGSVIYANGVPQFNTAGTTYNAGQGSTPSTPTETTVSNNPNAHRRSPGDLNNCIHLAFDGKTPIIGNNVWDNYTNRCNQAVNITVAFFGVNSPSVFDLASGASGGTANSQRDYQQLGGSEYFTCPAGFGAADLNGKYISRPVRQYICREHGWE